MKRFFALAVIGTLLLAALLSAVAPLGAVAPLAAASAPYSITDLGTLGGAYSGAYAVNASGDVVGHASTANGEYHATLWTADGGIRDLGTLGGRNSVARAINASGQVVGWAETASGNSHAFLWTSSGGMQDLGTLGGNTSEARGINASGQVVGYSQVDCCSSHAFLWTTGGGMQDLGTFGAWRAEAYGINDSGQIVGRLETAGGYRAFLYSDGVMTDLGTLGGYNVEARAINNAGQVVGLSLIAPDSSGYAGHAFLWTSSGGMQDLGKLSAGRQSWANGINDSGQVVGFADREYTWGTSFLYSDGLMVDLLDLLGLSSPTDGWQFGSAEGINDAGQIVGGGTYNGLYRAFLMSPPSDGQAPVATNVQANPNPAPANVGVTLTATISDTSTGGSPIASAQYRIDGSSFLPLDAADGHFDSPVEAVVANIVAFPTAGVHDVCVRGTDAAGNAGMEQCILLAVYDSSGGFATGAGLIDSPLGAYTLGPSLTGKALFAFVSKYASGATVPSGQTQFRFQVAALSFQSTTYDWLVVAGAKGQFKGSGTINGSGDYGFILTAVDGQGAGGGGTDKFRIKIWDKAKATDNLVYDNQVQCSDVNDTAEPCTTIAAGSIVIQK